MRASHIFFGRLSRKINWKKKKNFCSVGPRINFVWRFPEIHGSENSKMVTLYRGKKTNRSGLALNVMRVSRNNSPHIFSSALALNVCRVGLAKKKKKKKKIVWLVMGLVARAWWLGPGDRAWWSGFLFERGKIRQFFGPFVALDKV